VLIIFLQALLCGFAVTLNPGIQTVCRHAQTGCYISYRQASFGHLFDCFGFEFFGIPRVAHGTA
jgi:hypothetical protein